MTADWRAQDAQANYAEALRCMRAALLEKRQRPVEAPGPGRPGEGVPPATNEGETDAATR